MKILVISAQFPPDHTGGYQLRIKNIVDGLSQKGHTIKVLTTCIKKPIVFNAQPTAYPVIRKLHNRYLAKFFPKEILFDLCDTKFLERQIKTFQPDLIYLGHIYVLSKALLPYLADIQIPIVLDEGGASLKGAWTEKGRWFRFTGDYGKESPFIRAVKPLVIKLVWGLSWGRIHPTWSWPKNMHVVINSQYNLNQLKTLGIPFDSATVLYSGIHLAKFPFRPRRVIEPPISIICPGRIERRKGMLDSVRLLEHIILAGIDARLIFAGPVRSEVYQRKLLKEIQSKGIQDEVTIYAMLTQGELVKLYHQSDFCFFPSYQEMGFSRTPLEAMACGCVVISYGNEGSNEFIKHNQNGFLIKPEDFQQAIDIITHLMHNSSNVVRIVSQAREDIEKNHSLKVYIEKIEAILTTTVQTKS